MLQEYGVRPLMMLYVASVTVSDKTITTVIIPIFAVLGGIAGYFLKYLLDRKQASASASAQYKRDMYQGYVDTTLSFYQKQPDNEEEKAERTKKFYEDTKEFQSKFVLDATPAVIKAIRRQHRYFTKCNAKGVEVDGRKSQRKNARIFKMMRRDIGTSNWSLGPTASLIFSPINLYSYEETMHPIWWRVKKRTRKLYWRVTASLSTRLLAYKKRLYDWGAKD